MSVKVKICGITDQSGLDAALDAGVDAVGFNFHPHSPRYIGPQRAAALVARVPAGVATVGVFVNLPLPQVRMLMDETGIAWAQFHGDESLATLVDFNRPWYPALRPGAGETRLDESWPTPVILVDARREDAFGGTGQVADWQAAARLSRSRRVILAGGLTPENLPAAMKRVRPWAVDLNSGVESAPGCKNAARVRQALHALAPWRRRQEEAT